MQAIQELITLATEKVGEVAQSDVVIGEPITFGAVTVVPLSRVSVGFGGGGGQGEGETSHKRGGESGKGTGLGVGGGGKVRPVAVIVFGPSGVEVHPIPDKPGVLDKLFAKVPELVEKLQAVFDGRRSTDASPS